MLYTDANISFQDETRLTNAQVRARLIDTSSVNTRWIYTFIHIYLK